MRSISERDYYTVVEAVEILDVSHSTVWRWIRSGKIPAYRVGSRNLRIKQRDLGSVDRPEPGGPEWEHLSLSERRQLLLRPLSEEERKEQQELYREATKDRARFSIAPMTSDELIRRSREKEFWYGSES